MLTSSLFSLHIYVLVYLGLDPFLTFYANCFAGWCIVRLVFEHCSPWCLYLYLYLWTWRNSTLLAIMYQFLVRSFCHCYLAYYPFPAPNSFILFLRRCEYFFRFADLFRFSLAISFLFVLHLFPMSDWPSSCFLDRLPSLWSTYACPPPFTLQGGLL